MISVQNLHRLLNGNKLLIVLSFFFFISSCGIFSNDKYHNKHKKRRKSTVHKKKPAKKTKVDTLQWPSDTDNKDTFDLHGTVKKDMYIVDLLIPFNANKNFEDIESLEKSSTNRFLHYYSGILLALEKLEKENGNFILNVYDAPVKNDRISYIKSKMNSDPPDIIIGPYDKSQLKNIANYGKRKGINVVSPWKSYSSIGKDNPNYIQLNPSLEDHYKALIQNVDSHFKAENVYLVGRDSYRDKARMKKVNELHKLNALESDYYNILPVNEDSLQENESVFSDIFKQNNDTKVFIIPNWSFKDEYFIYSVLRRLNVEKADKKVYVYGMPIMLKSDKIGYNYFKRLNIRVASTNFINDRDYKIRKFKSDFYSKFKVFPLENAYEGYDMMLFIGENLMKYGTKFQYFIENKEFEYLSNTFLLKRSLDKEDIENENLDKINGFESTSLSIVGFNYNKFEKIK